MYTETKELSSKELNEFWKKKSHEIYDNLIKMSHDPMKYNEKLLMKIIGDNKDTEFGQKYDFANIKTIKDYQEKVPLTTFDDYAGYIYRMIEKGEKNLMTAYDIVYYAKSSGTMGNPKHIPITNMANKVHFDYISVVKLAITNNEMEWYPIDEAAINLTEISLKELKDGTKFGAVSGKQVLNDIDLMKYKATSPIEAVMPNPETNTRYLHTRFALMNKDITNAFCTYTSLFLDTLRYIENDWELLLKDIENGTIDETIKMPENVRKSVLKQIEPMPQRAKELREIFENHIDEPLIPLIWPKLKIIYGIGTGGFSNYYDKLKERFMGNDINFYFIGLTASEGVLSAPYELNNPNTMLLPDSVFYEFLPLGSNDPKDILTIDKLEVGKKYEVIITNLSGFYRYKMRDAIEIVGMKNKTPLIKFLYRIDQSISFAGENTSEEQLRKAAYKTEEECGLDLIEFSAYVDNKEEPKCVFIMEITEMPEGYNREKINKVLSKNVIEAMTSGSDELTSTSSKAASDYGHKIKSGILNNIELRFAQPETYLLYRDIMISKGTSSAQLKPPRILNELQQMFFSALLHEEYNK